MKLLGFITLFCLGFAVNLAHADKSATATATTSDPVAKKSVLKLSHTQALELENVTLHINDLKTEYALKIQQALLPLIQRRNDLFKKSGIKVPTDDQEWNINANTDEFTLFGDTTAPVKSEKTAKK